MTGSHTDTDGEQIPTVYLSIEACRAIHKTSISPPMQRQHQESSGDDRKPSRQPHAAA